MLSIFKNAKCKHFSTKIKPSLQYTVTALVSLFPGFSTTRESENFENNFQDFENPRDSRDSKNSRQIFSAKFSELDCYAFFFVSSGFQISFLAFCYVVLTNLV